MNSNLEENDTDATHVKGTATVSMRGEPTIWTVRDGRTVHGKVFGRFRGNGIPYFMIERDEIGWPEIFDTFAEAEAKVREI